jgi:Rrf2 family protein
VRITTWAEYGLICALHLARRASEGPVTGRDVATRERLPTDYVEQILLRLRRADIVRSTRGARGGYVLARPADAITVRQIIQASELATFELHCVSNPVEEARCSEAHACSIRPVWQMLQRRIDDVLEGVRLADLLHEESVVRERVGLAPEPLLVGAGAELTLDDAPDDGGRPSGVGALVAAAVTGRALPVLQG